jgi:hypothetical protein
MRNASRAVRDATPTVIPAIAPLLRLEDFWVRLAPGVAVALIAGTVLIVDEEAVEVELDALDVEEDDGVVGNVVVEDVEDELDDTGLLAVTMLIEGSGSIDMDEMRADEAPVGRIVLLHWLLWLGFRDGFTMGPGRLNDDGCEDPENRLWLAIVGNPEAIFADANDERSDA